jgi:hypothetical protein
MWREIAHSCLLCHSQALAEQPYHRRNQTLMNGTFMTMAARMQLTGRAVATRAAAETGSTLPATPRPFGDPQHHLGELANGGGNPPSVVALPPYTRAGRIAHPNSPKTAPRPAARSPHPRRLQPAQTPTLADAAMPEPDTTPAIIPLASIEPNSPRLRPSSIPLEFGRHRPGCGQPHGIEGPERRQGTRKLRAHVCSGGVQAVLHDCRDLGR